MNDRTRRFGAVALGALVTLAARRAVAQELTMPQGTAVDVLVEDALSSRTAKVGDQFRAVLMRALWADGRLMFPRGSVVEGRVDVVKSRADGSRSGFVGVTFVRIELPGSRTAEAASALAAFGSKRERVDVVLVGRAVDDSGAAPADVAAAEHTPRTQSADTDVEVTAGTLVRLELGEPLSLHLGSDDGAVTPGRVSVLPATVSAAQRALRKQGRYRGPIDGLLGSETRQAIIQFQLSRRQLATGDLDDPTLRLLEVTQPPAL